MRRASRTVLVIGCAPLVAGACSLFADFDGLAGAPSPSEAGGGDAAPLDATPALPDAGADVDAGPRLLCPLEPADPSLIAWFPFEEGSGDAVKDCSASGYDGAALGPSGAAKWVQGRHGLALDLNGDNACFDLGVTPKLAFTDASFTVTAWVWPRRYATSQGYARWLVSRRSNGHASGWHVGTDGPSSVELDVSPDVPDAGTDSYEVATALAPDRWVHVAAVYEPGVLRLYLDGVEAKVGSSPLAAKIVVDPAAHTRVGCEAGLLRGYDGLLDDLRVYARVLSESEISALAK